MELELRVIVKGLWSIVLVLLRKHGEVPRLPHGVVFNMKGKHSAAGPAC